MFAVAVDLLCRRYTAMQFNDRTEPEWPPHPARLFSAMTAAWADADEPDLVERSALQWLEGQSPPEIACSAARRRAVVTHFVPVNDPTALTRDVSRTYTLMAQARSALTAAEQSADERQIERARAALIRVEAKVITDASRVGKPSGHESASMATAILAVLPENRGKQGRTYPTVIPDEATFWFLWSEAEPTEQHRRALDKLLARVGRIGHSSTFVSCRSATSAPSPSWVPGDGQIGKRLRVPRNGLIDRLELAFQSHQGSEPRLLPAGMVNYRPPSAMPPMYPAPLLGGDWLVLGVTERRPPSAVRALDIARAARRALLAHGDQPSPEMLSGHQRLPASGDGPTPPLEQPHLAVVPLPNAGHPYSDGAIFGIALVLPVDCGDEERSAVERAVLGWSNAGFELFLPGRSGSSVRQVLEDLGVDRAAGSRGAWLDSDLGIRRRTTTRSYWCRPARRWLTVTPIALDRFPGNLRSPDPHVRDRAEAEAKASIGRACSYAGLPGDPSVIIRLDSPLSGLPAAPAGRRGGNARHNWLFPSYQTGSGTPRACVHAEIEFDVPVPGPVLIGAGRYFGYGLCLPSDANAEEL